MAKLSLLRAGDPRVFVNRDMAQAVANQLRLANNVHSVELFGSIARDGRGRDMDIIIVADDDMRAWEFTFLVAEMMECFDKCGESSALAGRRDGAYHYKGLRREMAMAVFDLDFGMRLHRAEFIAGRANLDIFVFPPNWRNLLHELQEALPHSDPMFMENIARDAVPIA